MLSLLLFDVLVDFFFFFSVVSKLEENMVSKSRFLDEDSSVSPSESITISLKPSILSSSVSLVNKGLNKPTVFGTFDFDFILLVLLNFEDEATD